MSKGRDVASPPGQAQAGAHEGRSFASILLLISGPVLQAGGWGAAFTDIGAVFVFGGTAMSVAGFAVFPTPKRLIAAAMGILLGGWGWLFGLWFLAPA